MKTASDGDAIRQKAGAVPGGQPRALTAVDSNRVLAAAQNGVYKSRAGGRTSAERLPVSTGEGR
ncbi:hypothetical protein [Streptomyces sp. NPDC058751]|uniref:hypothetical protein n=1 Tax=Streptomyces sp. NPDC058751 TaxID=3346623 RepID=UPI0036CDAC19